MEIQGLCAPQNLQSQHGGPRKSVPSLLRSTAAALSEIISTGTEDDGVQSDRNNNSRPRTSPFHLLVEHGSGATCSPLIRPQPVDRARFLSPCLDNMALNTKKEPEPRELLGSSGSVTIPWKNEESAIQMALSLFEGDDELVGQPNLAAVLREQCVDAAQGHYCLNGHGVATGVAGDSITSAVTKERLDVFNADGSQIRAKRRAEASVGSRGGRDETEPTRAAHEGSTEAGNCQSIFCYSLENQKPERQPRPKAEPGMVLWHDCASAANASRAGSQNTVEHVVVANNYSDKIRGHSSTQNSEGKVAGDLDQGVGLVTAMDSSDFFSTVSPGVPTSETFSGIITINNQNIIVTLENGVLTLAAPQEGCVHKEEDVLTIKEHLGMKHHEDIVLNYESRTKSIGKIGTLAVTTSGPQDEPRPGFSDSGSELVLVDGCSVSELGPSLDSGPIVKQEAAVLCAVTEGALVTPPTKVPITDCTTGDFPSIPLIRSKKETPATFSCQKPGCSCVFDTRQKLKVHLLNHAEDPRPYQCTVEGCGWAFATSYKLKRHLQSHDKQRPHTCQFEGCGRRFTTIYNLKAHIKVHEQDNTFVCEICSERFRSATRLANHQRVHFEPQRPHKCEFPGCEKSFITFSALFSHNRTHFRESGHYTCSYPGCGKIYDKGCRLKIHMRSHTGERPFICDYDGCGWSFTSMSKLLRHKRKHDDDRRFICTEEGCGKSFTRAEHLKGHSITHLGTKPFLCHADGCNARFSARSSLYIHSKKHRQDGSTLKTLCPMANCSKNFSSRSSLKSHIMKQHHVSPDALSQMETIPTLTPSSELISSSPATVVGASVATGDQLTNLDLNSLFSSVPGGSIPNSSVEVGIPPSGSTSNGTFTMDLSLVNSGILTIDSSSVSTALSSNSNATLSKAKDPLILASRGDMGPHHSLDRSVGDVLPQQHTINLDEVQTVTPEALGNLTALAMQDSGVSVDPSVQQPLSSTGGLHVEPTNSLVVAPVAELLTSSSKVIDVGGHGETGPLLGCVEVLGPGGKVLPQFVFPSHSNSFSPQKDQDLNVVPPSSFLESGGSARTDYRAIQLAKKKKQRGSSASSSGSSGSSQRKCKAARAPAVLSAIRYSEGSAAANGGLTLRDPITGAQYVQIQLLQDDSAGDGDLAFQLSSQPSSSHSQLTADLPVNILQEPAATAEDDGSDNSQFTGSTINLQDLE
ncbi:zinc finger protein ZXDC isoform X2 [Takifugu rubripes]|uniref:Si:dkey-156n14.3 n=1 Tax=Takifugu rubripes TaxID=31033 RepID=A0A3B5KKQ9_TAKRU|nr:zinc finger protein ZXDC-like isoform X2 [Takifugu rubripes]